MTGPGTVTVEAPAKLTLSLRITGVREDGLHLIDAEMVTLDLADELTFAKGDSLAVVERALGGTAVPADGDNLVITALRMLGQRASVRLVKRIPAGGGLGGGSADAAAVMRWAGSKDMALAERLGADVPFCLVGGRARVGGIGEVIQPLAVEDVAGHAFTLLTPPFGVSTARVYETWDRMGGPRGLSGNDLEVAALLAEPRLESWRNRLGDATGVTPMLAGSGSTWFVAGAYPADGHNVVHVAAASQVGPVATAPDGCC